MGWNNGTSQPNSPAFWQDPRLYQIVSLSTLLLYGLLWLHFDISFLQIVITLVVAQLTQYVGTHYFNLPYFDPKSALISSLSLCLLLRTNDLTIAALAACIAITSKFVIR
jgi:enediyne biosynthesis protein E5